MTQHPTATIVSIKQKNYSLTWIIPVIAIGMSCFLYARWAISRGPQITITFDDISGLTVDAPVMYRGAIVGRIENITLVENNSNVEVAARLDRSASGLAVEGSRWWIVRPSVSLHEISGLETIVGPRYLQASVGTGKPTHAFTGSSDANVDSGKNFTLIASDVDDVTAGTPIYYRGIKIGSITDVGLAENASTVRLRFNIQPPYAPIIRTNSKFWNVSGVSIEAGLSGINLHTGSLASLIKGGISVATPENLGDVAPVGYAFDLLNDFEKEWLMWSPTIDLSDSVQTR
jgi:paraquat-inducible protein B